MTVAERMTIEEVADAIGVTRQTLHLWQREGCPVDSPEAAQRWRDNNKRPRYGGPSPNARAKDQSEIQQAILLAQVVKIREEGRSKKLKNDILEGRLWDADAVLTTWRQAMHVLRARIEAIPEAAGAEVPREQRAAVEARIEELLRMAMAELENTTLEP